MDNPTIAISGINATDNPGPGIPVAKSLKQSSLNANLIGLSYDVNDPGNYLPNLIDRSFILPYPTNGWEGIRERLAHIKNTHGLDVIIPCLDAELPLYIKHKEELAEMGIATFLPDEDTFELRNKDRLTPVAETIGAAYPRTWSVYSIKELNDVISEHGLPLMVKGAYYKAYRAKTQSEAWKHFDSISKEWGFPILCQELVYGEELNVVGVGDGKGGHVGMVAIKKQTTTSLGKIWSGITIQHDALIAVSEAFVKQTKWRGPFEIECIIQNDHIWLLEINPRFPAWVYFATGVGINLPERLVHLMSGRECNASCDYEPGKVYMRFTDEVVCDLDCFSNLVTQGEHHAVNF